MKPWSDLVLDNPSTDGQRRLVGWLKSRENTVKSHRWYLKVGLKESIINRAVHAKDEDRKIVTKLFIVYFGKVGTIKNN